jgi:hypothetical protein
MRLVGIGNLDDISVHVGDRERAGETLNVSQPATPKRCRIALGHRDGDATRLLVLGSIVPVSKPAPDFNARVSLSRRRC